MKVFDAGKTRMIALSYGKKNYDDMLSRFHLVPERNGQMDGRTDGRTDRQICYINIARQNIGFPQKKGKGKRIYIAPLYSTSH